MDDQNVNYGEKENEAQKSEIESDAEKENEAGKSEVESDAEFDSELPAPTLAPNLQELYRAAMDGKWETAKAIIDLDPTAKTKRISSLGFTALHVAASCGRSEFVVELVKLLGEEELEITDQVGRTALHHVALASNVKAAKAMVEKNLLLPQLGDMNFHIPLLYAAKWRHPSTSKKMLEYLHQVTKDEPPFYPFIGPSASNLIVAMTASGSYDIALCTLRRHPELVYKKNDKRKSILHVLAMQPSAFRSGNKLSLWKSFLYRFVDQEETLHQHMHSPDDETNINVLERIRRAIAPSVQKLSNCISGMRKVSEIKQRHLHAVNLVKFVCEELQKKSITFIQDFFIPEDDTAILHLATEHGALELVQICLTHFPDLIWYANNKKRLLLHAAIEYRRVDIFNYMIDLIGKNTKAYAELEDKEHQNNLLHLAAKLAPSSQLQSVPGPAFQMQRELQWFKAVEALVYYESTTEKNRGGKTPQELFFACHEKLLENAKSWMKDTSNSCMVVAALVATVAFAAMVTVPGGNDSGTGSPILSKTKLFIIFSISNALSMISSAISLLMFLSVQTSRYTEEDFLDSLPRILLKGLFFLFIAVATMMVSFAIGIGLSLQKRVNWAYIPITIVACFPAIIFTRLQLPLLFQTLLFTSGPRIFQTQRDRKFWSLNKIGYRLLANDVP